MSVRPVVRLVLAFSFALSAAAPLQPSTALAAPSNNVLILDTTVSGGINSLEAQAVRAQGLTPVVVNGATWQGMTTAQFATYRAIVLGDPTCSDASIFSAAAASTARWGSAVTGNVVVIGTDPVYHQSQGGRKLVNSAMAFVLADTTRTGAYMDLSCAYHGSPSQPVPVLAPFGSFTVHGVGCADNIDIVAHEAALTGLVNADLTNWSCSVHEAFSRWPGPQSPGSGGTGDFLVLAIDSNNGSTFHAPDGSVGDPYILARGAGLIPITGASPTDKCPSARFQFPTAGHVGWLYMDPRSQWDGPPNLTYSHIDSDDFRHPTIHVGLDFFPSSDNRVWPLASGIIYNMNASGTHANIWYNDAGNSHGVTTYITELQFDQAVRDRFAAQVDASSRHYVTVDPSTPIGTTAGHVHMSFSSVVGDFDSNYDDFDLAQSQNPSSFFTADLYEPSGANFQAYIESYNARTRVRSELSTGLVPVANVDPATGPRDIDTYVPSPSTWDSHRPGGWRPSFDSTKLRNPYTTTGDGFAWTGSHFCNLLPGGVSTGPSPSRIVDRSTPMTTGSQTSDTFWLDGALLGLQQIINVLVGPVYSDVDVVLTSPDGTLVNPTDPGVQYTKTANFVSYTIQNAQTGLWTYTVVANALDANGENVRVTVDETNGGSGLTDLRGPATAAALSPAPRSGVNTGPVTIALAAVDNPGGVGVQSVTFGTIGAESRPTTTVLGATASFTVTAVGATTVFYFATDNAGNQEILRTLNVQIAPGASSLVLGGTTSYVEADASPDLNITGDWTVESWFKDEDPNGFNHARRTILSKGDTAVSTEVPYFVQVGDSNIIAGLRTGGRNYLVTWDLNAAGLRAQDWHHVAVSFNATLNVLNLWLDGKHITYLNVPGHSSDGNALPLDIGRKGPVTGNYWLGKIDDVRIWNIARKGTDITPNYRSQLDGPQPGLVANWHFDEGSGGNAGDSAGTHTGTLFGGAGYSTDSHP